MSDQMKNTILASLMTVEDKMDSIFRVSGAAGMSFAVIHEEEPLYTKHLGYRDVQIREVPNDETVYFIGSMTKAMASAVTGILVKEGLLDWSTPAFAILPELAGNIEGIGSQMTVSDLLSHHVGAARADALWLQRAGNILIPKSQGIETWTTQPRVREFRAGYLYTNFGYDMVGRIIEKLTGKSLVTILKEKLFTPLGMSRTSIQDLNFTQTNAAKAYHTLDDGSSYQVPSPMISDNTLMAAAGSVRSCTSDLVRFYSNFLHAVHDQFEHKTSCTPGSPFKQLLTILRPHNQLQIMSLREQSYALGWGRAELPCTLGAFNYNKGLVPVMPTMGAGAASRLTVYHGGSTQGFTSAVYTFPESETAVFALQNSTALCDACDWVPQMAIQALFGGRQPLVDFEELAKTSAAAGASLASNIEK